MRNISEESPLFLAAGISEFCGGESYTDTNLIFSGLLFFV